VSKKQSKISPATNTAGKNRKSANRWRISQSRCRRLCFECENLAAADAAADLARPLASFIARDGKLKAAWERGQFLRNLEALAGVVETVSEAAGKLKLSSGRQLREILDTDIEAADIWSQTRLDTRIAARQALLAAARDGNQAAIKAVENYLRDDQRAASSGPDMSKLMQKQVADLFDVNRLTVRNWVERHGCPQNADGSYDLGQVIKWFSNYQRRKSGTHVVPADKLRDLKVERMALQLSEEKGELLNREEVIAGLLARWRNIVGAFKYKRRELASMCHNQTVEGIEDIVGRFFAELQQKQLEVPEFLKLEAGAEKKLIELFDLLTTKDTK
jgi:phage terminase Nu1 subunit (DNA packaging protein)